MAGRAKIAISLAPEVVELIDRHAGGRSRSRCIEQELLRAFRARECERLSAQLSPQNVDAESEWAARAFASAHDALAREEAAPRSRGSARKRSG